MLYTGTLSCLSFGSQRDKPLERVQRQLLLDKMRLFVVFGCCMLFLFLTCKVRIVRSLFNSPLYLFFFFGKKKWPFAKATDQRKRTEKTRIESVKNEVYKCKVVIKIPLLDYKRLENQTSNACYFRGIGLIGPTTSPPNFEHLFPTSY